MRVLVTGASGFIGKNFRVALAEQVGMEAIPFARESTAADLRRYVETADAVVHLAGVNRPRDASEFRSGNADFTAQLCNVLRESGRSIPLLFSSSTQAERETPYGQSKRIAEEYVLNYGNDTGAAVGVVRLPNVFGKWSSPNYNSVVATFCYNVVHGLPLTIHDPRASIRLVYIDDVVAAFLQWLEHPTKGGGFGGVTPTHVTTVGELAEQIQAFRGVRDHLITERVGAGLVRALYSTYISFLPPAQASYPLPVHSDARGVFVEMLKTSDSGQISFFTAKRGVSRGGHYHHSKSEKFLVIKGTGLFRFRHILTKESFELTTTGATPVIVETIPGWAHSVTSVGEEELIVMLWANEIFDRSHPDTFAYNV